MACTWLLPVAALSAAHLPTRAPCSTCRCRGAAASGTIKYSAIHLDSQRRPVLAYLSDGCKHRMTVKRFEGGAWHVLGAPCFGPASPNWGMDMILDRNDLPVTFVSDEDLDIIGRQPPGTVWRAYL